ncbi:MAG: TetR family transcriptional regulator [Solirubrobacteraceae bacterium]|nr:TetR family transcriptional regulator [Solirubrobacteraceae bacterium]
MTTPATRKPRADALANRQKLLEAARFHFTQDGPDASLNEIAKRAGVGAGTLYRHFPTRDDLVAAVYGNELEELGNAVDDYLATMTADEALDAWAERFIEYASTKRGLGEALKALRERGDVRVNPRGVLTESMDKLIDAGRQAGTITSDADGEDLLLSMAGLWSMPNDERFEERARRIVRLTLGGLRHAGRA